MKRIRTLGLGVAMALGLMAMPGSAVGASGFYADQYPATFAGQVTSNSSISIAAGKYNCNEKASTINSGPVTKGLAALAITPPASSKCVLEVGGGFNETLLSNGCSYSVHPQTKVGATTYAGTFSIGPAGCGPMTLSYPGGCKLSIGPQSGLASMQFENVGAGKAAKVVMKAKVAGIKYSVTGCGLSSGEEMSYEATSEVAAFNESSVQIGAYATDQLPVGIFLAGSGGSAALNGERYPAALVGAQNPASQHLFSFDIGQVSCSQAALNGSLEAATAKVALTPSYAGCTMYTLWGEISGSFKSNGCQTQYTVTGTPYVGAIELQCPEGKGLEFTNVACAVTLPSQTLGNVSYENAGSGTTRTVNLSMTGKKVKYNTQGFLCKNNSYRENGSLGGGSILRGIE